ncbi:hypothetical protein O2V13_003522 [Vibrio parahaemolyticus]|nr:hypothetical protein [Vibrio parahaemolyticus]EHR1137126.1 hypothetical protein [Vibrio parahaemolyticus]EKG2488351.1 hypothetical protein [Vibrio parahaemolyticus]
MTPEELNQWQENLAQIPLDVKLHSLPFDMPWDYFEKLCLKLATEESNFGDIEVTDAMIYGRSGQKQEGIDVKGTIPNSKKFFVMQCKRYKVVTSGDITKWIDDFIKGKFSNQTSMYILATTFDIGSDTKLVDSWHEAQQKLDSLGVKSAIWDQQTILAKLKNAFRITSMFWGETIASKYCQQDFSENIYPYSYPIKNTNNISNIVNIQNNTCQLDLIIPTEKEGIRAGGIFSFARRDLHGTTFSIDGKAMIPLLQVKAHASSLRDTNYLYKSETKYYLLLANIRLTLEENEVNDLDWILDKAFSFYLESCLQIEAKYKTKRFERSNTSFKVKLCEIKQSLWNTIIDYAYTHDIANGDSSDFIYDSAPGCLKVFVDRDTENLDYGYHLIMYPRSSASMLNDNIILEWEPLNDIAGTPVEIGPRKAWDAEFTYQWLHTYLFPRVYNWAKNKSTRENNKNLIRRFFNKDNESKIPPLDYFIASNYVATSRHLSGNISCIKTMQNYTNKLQQHFTCYQYEAKIKKELIINVIDACIFLLNENSELNCNYIRGNLHLGAETTLRELILLKENKESRVYATSTMLDMALRSLGKLLELKHELSQYEIDSLTDYLSPVSDRYEEDRICKTYI